MSLKLAEVSTEEICKLLLENGFDRSVTAIFHDNKVDGTVFVELDKDDMKELGISALGDRKKLQQLIDKVKREKDTDFCVLTGSTPSRSITYPPRVHVVSPRSSSCSPDSCLQTNSPYSEETVTDSGTEQLESPLQSRILAAEVLEAIQNRGAS